MKTSTKLISSILVGIGLIGSAAAFHKPRWCSHGPGHWQSEHRAEEIAERVSERLELNEAQTTKLNRLKDQLLALREGFREDRERNRAQLMDMISAPELDQQRALDMVRQRVSSMEQKAPEVIAAIADFHDNLDPEQKQKVREFLENRFDHGRWH